jgi:hypothetical protein
MITSKIRSSPRLSDYDKLKRDIDNSTYNFPGNGEVAGGTNYHSILEYCNSQNIEYGLCNANQLNLSRDDDTVNKYQNRDGVLEHKLDVIAKQFEEYGRIMWPGFAMEIAGDNGDIVHAILSGYHREEFAKRNNLEFHFIVLKCSERQAGVVASKSNALDLDAPEPINESGKKKAAIQQATHIIKEAGYKLPLSKEQCLQVKKELQRDMILSFEEYSIQSYVFRLTAIINDVMDEYVTIGDKTRLTLKNNMSGREQKLVAVQEYWQQNFDGETFEENSYQDGVLQLLSVSQVENFVQRINAMTFNPQYKDPFARLTKAAIHVAMCVEQRGGEINNLTKKNIDMKVKSMVEKLSAFNTNPLWYERDARPKFERLVVVATFMGQDNVVYDWVNSRKEFIKG